MADDERGADADDGPAGPSTDRRTLLKGAAAVAGWGALSRVVPDGARADPHPLPADPLAGDRGPVRFHEDFQRPDADTWGDPWTLDGVGNARVRGSRGHLEAGTNIYPSSRRAVAFARDLRAVDATISARLRRAGVGAGLVLRRVGPRTHYAAVLEREEGVLKLVARSPEGESVLARTPVRSPPAPQLALSLQARGTDPTRLTAALGREGAGAAALVEARDDTAALQAPGDPGVLATSETGFRAGPDWRTPIGSQSARAAWVVDAATQAQASPVPITEARQAATAQASTAALEEVTVTSHDAPGPTAPATEAATTLQPTPGGARVGVSPDVPGTTVEIEVSLDGSFDPPDAVAAASPLHPLLGAFADLDVDAHDTTVHWRPRLTRNGETTVGPTRAFRALPEPGSDAPLRLVVGSCATQFSTTFPAIADEDPDVFVWQGDLNYIDASGPLAQTETGYAAMWKDVLETPELRPILDSACFAPTRDDHDYGLNDCWSGTLPSHGITSWDQVVNPDPYYRFGGGHVDVWVLDTRRFRDDPQDPDGPGKTLLGPDQRTWIEDGLASSPAPFKLVCSPGPIFNVPNDSHSWARGFHHERDQVLDHVRSKVTGEVVFVTGDTHSGAVSRVDGIHDFRAAPMDIPGPGRHDPSSGETVLFSEDGKFYCTVDVLGDGGTPRMTVALKRDDGSTAFEETFTA